MTNEKTEPTTPQPKTKSADTLIEKKGETELTEEELSRAAGGCDAGSKDAAVGKI
jgi:hypothetical protein